MEVSFHANIFDLRTQHIAKVLSDALEDVEEDLQKDYGGIIEHLWIDFELIESNPSRPFPFRFQKKVGGSIFPITGMRTPISYNVGHYSVRPDFKKLLSLSLESVATYALSLIYSSTSILIEKQKRLGGFDALKFREDLLKSCKKRGYKIDPHLI